MSTSKTKNPHKQWSRRSEIPRTQEELNENECFESWQAGYEAGQLDKEMPEHEIQKRAMLSRANTYEKSMPKFSTRNQAFKEGWKSAVSWLTSLTNVDK